MMLRCQLNWQCLQTQYLPASLPLSSAPQYISQCFNILKSITPHRGQESLYKARNNRMLEGENGEGAFERRKCNPFVSQKVKARSKKEHDLHSNPASWGREHDGDFAWPPARLPSSDFAWPPARLPSPLHHSRQLFSDCLTRDPQYRFLPAPPLLPTPPSFLSFLP